MRSAQRQCCSDILDVLFTKTQNSKLKDLDRTVNLCMTARSFSSLLKRSSFQNRQSLFLPLTILIFMNILENPLDTRRFASSSCYVHSSIRHWHHNHSKWTHAEAWLQQFGSSFGWRCQRSSRSFCHLDPKITFVVGTKGMLIFYCFIYNHLFV